MKNKNTLIGLALAGAAGIAYFVSKAKKDKAALEQQITDAQIKAKQDAEKAALELARAKKKAAADAQSLLNKKSLATKVATIQLYLGVPSDGVVGQNTNIALKKKFPAYSTITSANVDQIIATIESDKKSAADLAAKKTATVTLQQKKTLAAKLEVLTKTGNKPQYYAKLLKNVSAPVYLYDKLTSSYKWLGTYAAFNKDKMFYDLIDRQNGEVLSRYNDYRYAFNPSDFVVLEL